MVNLILEIYSFVRKNVKSHEFEAERPLMMTPSPSSRSRAGTHERFRVPIFNPHRLTSRSRSPVIAPLRLNDQSFNREC